MYCNHCGYQMPDESEYCDSCGEKMLRPEIQQPAASPVPQQAPPTYPASGGAPYYVPPQPQQPSYNGSSAPQPYRPQPNTQQAYGQQYPQQQYTQPPYYGSQQQGYTPQKTNMLAVVGLVLAFISPVPGLILSIFGRSECIKRNEQGKGLATAGIVIAILRLLLGFVVAGFIFAVNGFEEFYYMI